MSQNFPFLKIFFWNFLDNKLSISHSPCPLASGRTWNVKIIESRLNMQHIICGIPVACMNIFSYHSYSELGKNFQFLQNLYRYQMNLHHSRFLRLWLNCYCHSLSHWQNGTNEYLLRTKECREGPFYKFKYSKNFHRLCTY